MPNGDEASQKQAAATLKSHASVNAVRAGRASFRAGPHVIGGKVGQHISKLKPGTPAYNTRRKHLAGLAEFERTGQLPSAGKIALKGVAAIAKAAKSKAKRGPTGKKQKTKFKK
jgi:hypothetical protein